jgi:hypothetical protein
MAVGIGYTGARMSIPVSPIAAELAAVPTLPAVAAAGVAEVGADISSIGADNDFYSQLPEIAEFRDVSEPASYAEVPRSALLVLTDVRGSTAAIEAGRYRDVNALGVATIIALCNAMADLEVPYMFGGDGATLLIPASRRPAAERALRAVRALAETSFELGLRASIVPMAELIDAGHVGRVARFRVSPQTRLAMFSGSAFSTAERWFKDPALGPGYEVSAEGESTASFEGFECRWQPLVSRRGSVVSLIVSALSPSQAARSQTYRDILRAFERIVDGEACHPVQAGALRLKGFWGDYSVEARIRAQGAAGPAYAAAHQRARKQTLLGRMVSSIGLRAGSFDGSKYKRELSDNSDFRKFDESLRMVVDLNRAELYRFESRLAAEHRAGRLAYGLHRSPAALVTCLVRSYRGDHVHFIDGSDGGYALAARALASCLKPTAEVRRGPQG